MHAALIANPIRAVRLSETNPDHACASGWNNIESAFESCWQKGFHVYISLPQPLPPGLSSIQSFIHPSIAPSTLPTTSSAAIQCLQQPGYLYPSGRGKRSISVRCTLTKTRHLMNLSSAWLRTKASMRRMTPLKSSPRCFLRQLTNDRAGEPSTFAD